MKAKKKIGNPKPLVVGQKVYVMLWSTVSAFAYTEGTLKYKGPSKSVVEFTGGECYFEECYPTHTIVAKSPKARKILARMVQVSANEQKELLRLRKILDMLKA